MESSPSSIQIRATNAETESIMRLVEISAGYWLPRALHVVADLGVADALDQEPQSGALPVELLPPFFVIITTRPGRLSDTGGSNGGNEGEIHEA